jgi:tRNA 5-methylaminomethyl-2-thiouridine biosynthesis bifunctional protein
MKLVNPTLSWQASGHPYSEDYGDIYFSAEDPIGESQHVFLEGNQLSTRWQQLDGDLFTVAELGFGSGLNFLLTWKLWKKAQTKGKSLHYIAFEKHPLQTDQIQKLYSLWPELKEFSDQLIAQYIDQVSGCHRFLFKDSIILDLHYGDARDRLSQLERHAGIDAWYLDGFNPKLNSALWDSDILQHITRLSRIGTTLSTYSVAGNFRRTLNQSGFATQKTPGFGQKRHMLQAHFEQAESQDTLLLSEPWNIVPGISKPAKKIAIIGGGLAGCSLAYSLSQRGIETTIYEAASEIAAGASGIPLFSLRPRLFQSNSSIAEFYLHSFLFSYRTLQSLSKQHDIHWNQCGVVQLRNALNKKAKLKLSTLTELYPESVLGALTNTTQKHLETIANLDDALFFPKGGMVSPASLCNCFCRLSNASIQRNTNITSVTPLNSSEDKAEEHNARQRWQLQDDKGKLIDTVDAVAFTTSQNVSRFEQLQTLPIDSICGQVSQFKGTVESNEIEYVISGERTLFPSTDNETVNHLVAASYRKQNTLDAKPTVSDRDNDENFAAALQTLSNKSLLKNEVLGAQLAIRSSTPDRNPLVGAVPNISAVKNRYSDLALNAHKEFDQSESEQNYWPGLFVSAAHGSNGLATCVYSSEVVASLICGEQLPIGQNALDALNPIRFTIRDLKKQIA